MADSPTIPRDLPTTGGTFLPYPCGQCLVAILVLGSVTALFMVLCLSLSFKLSRRFSRSGQGRRTTTTNLVPLELWASPPTSNSQTTLLWTVEPVPPPSFSTEWDEITARQPRVTLQDIGEFWWRSTAQEV